MQVVDSAGNFNIGVTGIGLGPLAALTPGIITTVAGNGTAAYAGDGGPATSAAINAISHGVSVPAIRNAGCPRENHSMLRLFSRHLHIDPAVKWTLRNLGGGRIRG